MRTLIFVSGLIFLFVIEIAHVYFIMPFPGSQQSNTIGIAYFINNNIFWLRLLAFAMVLPFFLSYFHGGGIGRKILLSGIILLYGFTFYLFNFRFLADKMFYQPRTVLFVGGAADTTDRNKLIIGLWQGGEAKAYPVEVIGYHHQVKDTVGGQPVLVTYCTVCRTGRVYSPIVLGHFANFRLVGMDHFNAMFEDADTKSWWQQATGTAISGPLKGMRLTEIPSMQMRLGEWMTLHPDSRTLQPDTSFKKRYADLKGYDEGTIEGGLEKRDTGSWKSKSWVIGVRLHARTRAYDWNELVKTRMIQDTIGGGHLLLTIEPNNKTFYAWSVADSVRFRYNSSSNLLTDEITHSAWLPNGTCVDGPLKGQKLGAVQAYQEFWHSWRTFHPETSKG